MAANKILEESYSDSGQFSPLALDFIAGADSLQSLYDYSYADANWENIISAKKENYMHRSLVAEVMKEQYQEVDANYGEKIISRFASPDCFTVCTAHQPLIFTGPAYFIHKIIDAIYIAQKLKKENPQQDFLAVFYLGTEDADWEEIGKVILDGKEYQWKPEEDVISGRALLNDEFIELRDRLIRSMESSAQITELKKLWEEAYQSGYSLSLATRKLLHALFAEYDLLLLDADEARLKTLCSTLAEQDLIRQNTAEILEPSLSLLEQNYKVQALPQEQNFFALENNQRVKISQTKAELKSLIEQHPDRLSPNVIFRPLYQELLLPNVLFTGGAAEIGYWLELKPLFAYHQIPMPALRIRKSLGLLTEKFWAEAEEKHFLFSDFFLNEQDFLQKNIYAKKLDENYLSKKDTITAEMQNYLDDLAKNYQLPPTQVEYGNKTTRSLLEHLEKKIHKQLRREYEAEIFSYERIKRRILPQGKLQERSESFTTQLALYSKKIIHEYMELMDDRNNISYLVK